MRGHANLLEDLHALEDLERVKSLFDDLETKRGVIDLLGRAERAEGVRIFIGSENKLFSLSGSSTIIAPYSDAAGRIVGVLGVIGPTRLNYAQGDSDGGLRRAHRQPDAGRLIRPESGLPDPGAGCRLIFGAQSTISGPAIPDLNQTRFFEKAAL